jgi:zinc protease
VIAGNVKLDRVKELAEKWFGGIPAGEKYERNLPQEPVQKEARHQEFKAAVPLDAYYKCWHVSARMDQRYYIMDLLADILGSGGSSRLHQALIKEKKLFSNLECYHFGSTDAGLLCIEGKLVKGVLPADADKAVEEELEKIKNELVPDQELQKVKNKTESMIAFEDMSVMNRANSLAYYELLGDAEWMNDELDKYAAVTAQDIQKESQRIFTKENSNTIFYLSDN